MTYRAIGLPNTCSNCHLSSARSAPIWGQSEVPLSNVSGIIISAYSGKEEELQKQVLVEANNYLNAGGFLRKVMRSISNNQTMFSTTSYYMILTKRFSTILTTTSFNNILFIFFIFFVFLYSIALKQLSFLFNYTSIFLRQNQI